MYNSMQDIIDNELKYVPVDRALYTKLVKFKQWWYNESYQDWDGGRTTPLAFLGHNLFGVNKFIFSNSSQDKFLKDIFKTSAEHMKPYFHNLDDVDTNFIVTSNPFLLTCCCMLSKTYQSKLDNKTKENIAREIYLMMAYKLFTSMYTQWLRYPVKPAAAIVVYEKLNNKYLLKKLGNWLKVFEYKTADVCIGGIHYDKLLEPSGDNYKIVISGIRAAWADVIKNVYQILMVVLDSNESIGYESSIVEINGKDGDVSTIREVYTPQATIVTYLKNIINSETDLINPTIVKLINKLMPRCSEEKLSLLLQYITTIDYPSAKEHDYIEKIISSSYKYLQTKRMTSDIRSKMYTALMYLKGYWAAGNIKEPEARVAKTMAFEIVSGTIDEANKSLIPTIAIGLLLYLFALGVYKQG